jgi:hypothetical protein
MITRGHCCLVTNKQLLFFQYFAVHNWTSTIPTVKGTPARKKLNGGCKNTLTVKRTRDRNMEPHQRTIILTQKHICMQLKEKTHP